MTPRFSPTQHEGVFKNVSSGIYWFRDTVHSQALESEYVDRSLKTTSIKLAKERADKIRRRIMTGEEDTGAPTRRTFAEVFDLVIKMQSDPKNDDDTVEQTKNIINDHLRPWFKVNCPFLSGRVPRYPDGFVKQYEEIWADYSREASRRKPPKHLKTQTQVDEWVQANSTPRKLTHDRRFLVMTLIRANRRGWVSRNFKSKDFKLNEVTEAIGKYLPKADVQALLDGLKGHPRAYLQVLMAVVMGMRKSEILHLHREEIDMGKREIILDPRKLKTRRAREVAIPIADCVFPLLKNQYEQMEQAQGSHVFPARYTSTEGQAFDWDKPQDDNSFMWDRVRAQTGINARFHDLRHTAITNMVKAGMPDTAIRKICGVEEGTMRRIYAHLEDELKAKFRGLFNGVFQVQGEREGDAT